MRHGKHRWEGLVTSRYHEREEEVDNIFSDLKEKHQDKYETPKLRLWAHMIIILQTFQHFMQQEKSHFQMS